MTAEPAASPECGPGQQASRRLLAPVRDRRGRFAPLKAATLAILVAPAAWLIARVWAEALGLPSPAAAILRWTGIWSTTFLLATLAVTPARRILRWRGLVAVRRMLGIGALAYSLAHMIAWFALLGWDWDAVLDEMLGRWLLVTGWTAVVGMLALAATSFDTAIARMGTLGWRRLHRAVYLVAILSVLHDLMARGRIAGTAPFTAAGLLLWLFGWRLLDRHRRGDAPLALAGLALAAAFVTGFVQAAWLWADVGGRVPSLSEFLETLALDFDPAWAATIMTPPAVWQVLIVGCLAAEAAVLARRWAPERVRGRRGGISPSASPRSPARRR